MALPDNFRALAQAIAAANHHPDPVAYADSVASFYQAPADQMSASQSTPAASASATVDPAAAPAATPKVGS